MAAPRRCSFSFASVCANGVCRMNSMTAWLSCSPVAASSMRSSQLQSVQADAGPVTAGEYPDLMQLPLRGLEDGADAATFQKAFDPAAASRRSCSKLANVNTLSGPPRLSRDTGREASERASSRMTLPSEPSPHSLCSTSPTSLLITLPPMLRIWTSSLSFDRALTMSCLSVADCTTLPSALSARPLSSSSPTSLLTTLPPMLRSCKSSLSAEATSELGAPSLLGAAVPRAAARSTGKPSSASRDGGSALSPLLLTCEATDRAGSSSPTQRATSCKQAVAMTSAAKPDPSVAESTVQLENARLAAGLQPAGTALNCSSVTCSSASCHMLFMSCGTSSETESLSDESRSTTWLARDDGAFFESALLAHDRTVSIRAPDTPLRNSSLLSEASLDKCPSERAAELGRDRVSSRDPKSVSGRVKDAASTACRSQRSFTASAAARASSGAIVPTSDAGLDEGSNACRRVSVAKRSSGKLVVSEKALDGAAGGSRVSATSRSISASAVAKRPSAAAKASSGAMVPTSDAGFDEGSSSPGTKAWSKVNVTARSSGRFVVSERVLEGAAGGSSPFTSSFTRDAASTSFCCNRSSSISAAAEKASCGVTVAASDSALEKTAGGTRDSFNEAASTARCPWRSPSSSKASSSDTVSASDSGFRAGLSEAESTFKTESSSSDACAAAAAASSGTMVASDIALETAGDAVPPGAPGGRRSLSRCTRDAASTSRCSQRSSSSSTASAKASSGAIVPTSEATDLGLASAPNSGNRLPSIAPDKASDPPCSDMISEASEASDDRSSRVVV
mmetsp:Transcript_96690/g.174617  ORF Transcript_96690/g.174617 Transcript_96690/m.174617 type:complete len:794 (-) Transcript_96690:823-3204(-)